MPRKKSAIPPDTRIRENQRRSRARRKELIEDLQHRLREYEEKEFQATLVVQLAARRVAWENTQLRGLLVRMGVSIEEIEPFIRGPERPPVRLPLNTVAKEEVQSSAAARDENRLIEASHVANSSDQVPHKTMGQDVGVRGQRDSGSTRELLDHDFEQNVTDELKGKGPRLDSSAPELKRVDSVQAYDSANEVCEYDALDQPSTVDTEQSSLLPTVSDYFYPALPTSGWLTGDDPMLKMSCETAASIISSMRGGGDREQARSQLDCKSREYCDVKNMKVLQVMETD